MTRRRAPARAGILAAVAALLADGSAQAGGDLFEMPIESLMRMSVSVASPFDEAIRDSASSVAVLRPADWELRGARSLEDALEQVPSVVPYTSLGGASMFAIRGYANDISTRGTAMLLDGVPLNNFSYGSAAYSLPFVALPLLQRVEVIRGAGSTLYGSDAFHGVVALSTWQASAQQRAARVSLGHPRQAQATLTGADQWSGWHVAGGLAVTDNGDRDVVYTYVDPLSGLPGSGEWDNDEQDGAVFVNAEHGELDSGRLRLGFYADRYDSDRFPSVGTQFYQTMLAILPASADYLRDRDLMGQRSDFRMAQARYERRVAEATEINVHLFGWESDQLWRVDASAYPSNDELLDAGLGGCRPQTPGSSWPLLCPHLQYQGTREYRSGLHLLLRHDGDDHTDWAIGGGRDWFGVEAAPVQRIGIDGITYYDAAAPFAGDERSIDHVLLQGRTTRGSLAAVYGVRWDEYSDVGDATSPRAALIWRGPGSPWTAKLQYAHAFRAPSATERYGTGPGTQQAGNFALQPETIDTLELAWQYGAASHDTELVLFGSRWQDGIVLTQVSPTISQYQNTGRNSAHGVELTHRRLLGNWRLDATGSWVVSENDRIDTRYVGFPQYLLDVGVSRQFGNGWEIGLRERIMLDMAEGDTITTSSPLSVYIPPAAPDYYRTDLHTGWRSGKLRLALDVRNLFGRDNVMPSMLNARGGLPEPDADVVLSCEVKL